MRSRSPALPRHSDTPTRAEPKRRAADIAYDAIETLVSTMQLRPGGPVVEADVADRIEMGRTPVREALLRMVSMGLIVQQPRRGLIVSSIDVREHLDVIATRRVLEQLIARCSARRSNAQQRKELVRCAEKMVRAAARGRLDEYMAADQELDWVNHEACQNRPGVNAVIPLIVQCRRFWYAYQHEGEIAEAARAHMQLAEGIASADEAAAAAAANELMDYLERFARRVIDK